MLEAVLFDLGDTLLHYAVRDALQVLDIAAPPVYRQLVKLGLNPPSFPTYLRQAKWQFFLAFLASRIRGREVQVAETVRNAHLAMGIRLDLERTRAVTAQGLPGLKKMFTKDPDALGVVERLHRAGLKLGVISNTFVPGFAIDAFLLQEGLLGYFPVRIYSSEVRYMKPDPKIFRMALDQLGVPARRAAFVGDNVRKDIWGAARVGMKTVLVRRSGRRPWVGAPPDAFARGLADVPAVLPCTAK
ncbi:MAG: HAD family hydrolase [Planctomycetes bacterium]|nr:HAD family hydrolase [Planctomycetota bacterium]